MQSPIVQPTSPPSGVRTDRRLSRQRLARTALSLLAGIGLAATAVSPIGLTQPSPTFAQSAFSPIDGVLMNSQRLTLPRGAVFLGGSLQSTTTTHWWVTDQVLGICRVDGASAPYQLNNCNGTARSGGQAVVATPANPAGLPAGARYVFVADASSKSVNVVRFVFNPANETLSSPLAIAAQNPTSVGGGAGGGRPVGLALAPNGQDLYVGYLKSGDVMKVKGATNSSVTSVSKIGVTSDGRGLNALAFFQNDLYLAEIGGKGLSKIKDPSGMTGAACAGTCVAQTVPNVDSFPGGLVADSTYLYIGHVPTTNRTPTQIERWNPATGVLDTYSKNVPPYTPTFDGIVRDQYSGPLGLGLGPNGDLLVGDDPTANLVAAVLPTLQGNLYRVPFEPAPPVVASLAPNNGSVAGGTTVTIAGSGLAALDSAGTVIAGSTSVAFGGVAASNVACISAAQCTAQSPATNGSGVVDVRVMVNGQQSGVAASDQFTYTSTPSTTTTGAPAVTGISPAMGMPAGGTTVTISGTNLFDPTQPNNLPAVAFGTNAATGVACSSATTCTAVSPAGTGKVDVQVKLNNVTSGLGAADQFSYTSPSPALYAWGITAPKGGALWVPGALGGHWWSSDHAQGFCRQDVVSATSPAATLHAINFSVCGPDTVGSAGQAVYDPRANADGSHYIYVPDNAVKSTAVWRLTFDPGSETVRPTAEAMVPLADVRTLKPNGMALGPDNNLYVSDLTEKYIRRITDPNGDPRLQTVGIVAQTGDGRGANGTMGFIGNRLYVSENRAAAWFDVTTCPAVDPTTGGVPCNTRPIPLPTGAFVAGVATDPTSNPPYVYASDSPGGAGATIWRYDAHLDGQALPAGTTLPAPIVYATGGKLPSTGAPNATVYCSLTCTRPWDPTFTPGGTASWSFVFGLSVGPDHSLIVTEDNTAGNRSGRGTMWQVPLVP